MSLTAEGLGLRWWRGAGGEWEGCAWCADDDDGGGGGGGGGGEKRGFDEVFGEEVDGR